jgi:hypothetical protein
MIVNVKISGGQEDQDSSQQGEEGGRVRRGKPHQQSIHIIMIHKPSLVSFV